MTTSRTPIGHHRLSHILGGAALAVALAACGGPRIVVAPDPDTVSVGVGLRAEFQAEVVDCGGFGDCARVRGSSVTFESLEGKTLGTDHMTFSASDEGSTRLRLRSEDLESEVVLRAVRVRQSEVFVETREGESEVRAFRGSTLSVGQRHQDTNGEPLYGKTDWVDDGVTNGTFSGGRATDGNSYRDLVVPSSGRSISTALTDPLHMAIALRIVDVDESAIAQIGIVEPSQPGGLIHVEPLAGSGRPICGGGTTYRPKLVASSGISVLVAQEPCGVNLTVQQKTAGPHTIELRWGTPSKVLTL
jgi:hypothetical protein